MVLEERASLKITPNERLITLTNNTIDTYKKAEAEAMRYFVVDIEEGDVRYEAKSYEEALLKMCHLQRIQGEYGICIPYEVVNEDDYLHFYTNYPSASLD